VDRDLRIRMVLEAADRFTRPVREMVGGSDKLAASLKGARDRLKEINRAQADIAGFRTLKRGVADTGAAMRQAEARATALGREIAQVEKPTRAMTRDFNAARREAAQLTAQHQAQTAELGQLRDRLRAAGVETTSLARHERELRTQAAGATSEIEEQSRALARAGDRARRFGAARSSFQSTIGTASGLAASGTAAIGTGVAMAAPLVGGIKAAQDYQSVMTDIAQKADLTRAQATELGKQLLVNARAANQMPDAMQAGVDTLSGLGARVPDAVKMMGPIGKAATAYKAEINDLSAASYAAVDNLKVPVAETQRIIEMMGQAGKAGAFEVKDMATYFPALTAAYQGLGQTGVNSVGDLAAALQITRKGAGDSASAAGNLSNILQKIMSPETIKNFDKFGIDLPKALKRAYAEGKTPIEAIAELTNKALGGDATKVGDLDKLGFLFGDAQVQQGLRPLIQNMAEYRRIRADAQGAGSIGSVDRDFAIRMQDSAEQTKKLTLNAQALGIQLGSTLLPAVTAVTARANAFADRLSAWAQANPGFARGLMLAAAGFAALFLVLGGGAILIAGLLAPFAALSFAAGALGIGLLPVIGIAAGVVAAIAALAAIAYLIYANWGGITGWFSNLWAGVTNIVTAAGSAISGALGAMWAGVKALFSTSLLDIYSGLFSMFGYALGALYRFGATVLGWLTGTLPGLLSSGFSAAWSMFTGAISAGVTWLTTRLPVMLANGWNMAWNGLKAAMRAAFVTLPAMFFDFGAMIIQGLWNGLKSGPSRLWAAGKKLAGSLDQGFRKGAEIKSPSRVFAALGGHIIGGLNLGLDRGGGTAVDRIARLTRNMAAAATIPAIGLAMPAQAEAATARRLVAASAEASTMIVNPARRTQPSPAARDAAAAMPAPAQLGTISITINQLPGQSAGDLAEAVRRAIEDLRREDDARSRSSFRDRQDVDAFD
jgi:TP901 family phage tail tape measure protein